MQGLALNIHFNTFQLKTVKLLLRFKANPLATDNNGRRPSFYAHNEKIQKILTDMENKMAPAVKETDETEQDGDLDFARVNSKRM